MNFYQEVTVIETPDISPYFIWGKLFTQVHLALVEQKAPNNRVPFGVSFPEYKCFNDKGKAVKTLGRKLRVFAHTEQLLDQLDLQKWLMRLTDYLHIKSVQAVPSEVKSHVVVSRYQPVKNLERTTRRLAKRQGISFEEALKQQNQRFAELNGYSLKQAEEHYHNPVVKEFPFIKISSLSSGNNYSLHIVQRAMAKECKGDFNTYGLSNGATVPYW
ncbi:type I-F CRISPR-associated endoribonuclease Cas6/Csy4 [Aliidiomarina taiwanensis]|uniref:Type I-F CRISPR-associated endoribonuclease Cas6/Csy4 n=1 Tax=Aliidiomarina taiwanensis TaxID=946228 RepID=A0A432X7C5_9GAMM|nr:type I-F CRISPR-associated endoribonuclease Cas6/Csy4 [Aliidiomarina taiwanensis]RUO42769.1 type I-F CRISPR-associated endoribonuclease Cas6/Csy4 [Aliidiomarina taiwanensis]